MYERADQMSPFYASEKLAGVAVDLIEKSSKLEGRIAPRTARAIAQLMLHANSYYSNLIEGQHTRPLDVEAHLRGPKAKNELVLLGAAHIRSEEAARERVAKGQDPFDPEFIRWLHRTLYERIPDSMKVVRGRKGREMVVVPGDWRDTEVEVGEHVAPRARTVPQLIGEFVRLYRPVKNKAITLLQIVAAHHRFAWIHPFLDGNGRVGRLLTHAWLRSAGIMGTGLWSISRGLGRNKDQYLSRLQQADQPRQGNYDGRGNLSQKALDEFCEFVLKVAMDQVDFMQNNFKFDTLEQRLQRAFGEFSISIPGVREEGWRLVREAVLVGEFDRGEAPRVTGLKERLARDVLTAMIKHSLLGSDSPKGKVYALFPVRAVSWYFPDLFPPADVAQYSSDIDGKEKSAARIPIPR